MLTIQILQLHNRTVVTCWIYGDIYVPGLSGRFSSRMNADIFATEIASQMKFPYEFQVCNLKSHIENGDIRVK